MPRWTSAGERRSESSNLRVDVHTARGRQMLCRVCLFRQRRWSVGGEDGNGNVEDSSAQRCPLRSPS
eukprot:23765-Alexandrium_andersonii.AAC.1